MFRTVDFGDLFGGGFGFGDLGFDMGGGLFDRLFGRRRAGPHRGRDIEVVLDVPLSRIVTGGEEKVRFQRSSICASCYGTGAKDGTKLHACASCAGTGQRSRESKRRERTGEVLVRSISICPECEGSGRIIKERCPMCHGRGDIEQDESLTVNVPVGVDEGMVLRVPGHGMAGDQKGGTAGDLPSHPSTAMSTWPSPPASSQAWCYASQERGFLASAVRRAYVRVEVEIPERLTNRQRELYEELLALEHAKARRVV